MPKVCNNPQCVCYKQPFPDVLSECPVCHTPFQTPQQAGGFNVNLGDANAISGGLTMSDNHSVSNNTVNNSTSNVDSHNVITNHYTQVERQKTDREILHEKEQEFRRACQKAYDDNVLEESELQDLTLLRTNLGLTKEQADNILGEVRRLSERSGRTTELSPMARVRLKQLSELLQKNDLVQLGRKVRELDAMVRNFVNPDLHFKYYLALAVINPERCIQSRQENRVDNYWQDFWSYAAYMRLEQWDEADSLLYDKMRVKYASQPQDDLTILAAMGELVKGNYDEVRDVLGALTGEVSIQLQTLLDAVYLLVDPEMANELGAKIETCRFYIENLLTSEAEKKRKKEEELKRQAAEEERIRAEEEKMRLKAEEKRRAEEEARRKAEQKAALEAKRKQEEIARQKALEEARKPVSRLVIGKDKYVLKVGTNLVGRADIYQPSDVQIANDPTISRKSIQIIVQKKTKSCNHTLHVLKSVNPVLVNGIQVMENEECLLNYNDIITLGRTELKLEAI